MGFSENENILSIGQQAPTMAIIRHQIIPFPAGNEVYYATDMLVHNEISHFRYYPLNQQFSSHLAQTGMYRNYSLNTNVDKPFCNQF